MTQELLLSARDRELIESLTYDPSAKPRFCSMRDYLVWPDEEPAGISPTGYEYLTDLLIARALMHHGLELPPPIKPEFFRKIWEKAQSEGLKWPGFNRLSLNDDDKAYYLKKLQKEDKWD